MKETNYKTLFFSGLSFIGAGVVFITTINIALGAAFIVLGSVFLIRGAKNKNKWSEK